MLKKKLSALSGILFIASCFCSTASYAWGVKSAPATQDATTITANTGADASQTNMTQNNFTNSQPINAANPADKVNINTASVETLQVMKFMSKTKAQKIVKYREEHGPFKSLNELLNVKCRGIHQDWLNKVSNMFTI